MKKIIATAVMVLAVLSAGYAVETVPSFKIGPSWIWTDVDVTVGGNTGHGSTSATAFTLYADTDIFFGQSETFGLRIGIDIVSFPIAGTMNGQSLDMTGASPAYARTTAWGISRRFTLSEKSLFDFAATLTLAFEDMDVPGAFSMDTFTLGFLADLEYAYKTADVFGFKLGAKLGCPLFGTVTMEAYDPYIPDMDQTVFPSGFFLMPYVGMSLFI